jgi:hypothetical protein
MRVSRSKASSGPESGKCVSASAASRSGFRSESGAEPIYARNNRAGILHGSFETTRKHPFFEQFVQVAGTFLRCSVARFRVRRSHQKEIAVEPNSRRVSFDGFAF